MQTHITTSVSEPSDTTQSRTRPLRCWNKCAHTEFYTTLLLKNNTGNVPLACD